MQALELQVYGIPLLKKANQDANGKIDHYFAAKDYYAAEAYCRHLGEDAFLLLPIWGIKINVPQEVYKKRKEEVDAIGYGRGVINLNSPDKIGETPDLCMEDSMTCFSLYSE